MDQHAAYEQFRVLHDAPKIFVMPNAWDGASAALLRHAGFKALGTTSLGIAFAMGQHDGTHAIGLADAVANGTLLAAISGLPVNGDLEDGFGPAPEHCAATVEAAIAGGLAGLGIEDTMADPSRPIHDFDAAVARVRAAAAAARGRILLTGRTDNYLFGRPDLDDTIRRLVAFAEVGADVLYAPGLPDLDAIRAVVRAVAPKPVNVMHGPRSGVVPLSTLEQAGVKRVSLGGLLYRRAMAAVQEVATAVAAGDLATASTRLSSADIAALLPTA